MVTVWCDTVVSRVVTGYWPGLKHLNDMMRVETRRPSLFALEKEYYGKHASEDFTIRSSQCMPFLLPSRCPQWTYQLGAQEFCALGGVPEHLAPGSASGAGQVVGQGGDHLLGAARHVEVNRPQPAVGCAVGLALRSVGSVWGGGRVAK